MLEIIIGYKKNVEISTINIVKNLKKFENREINS